MSSLITDQQRRDFFRDGAVYLPGVFKEWVDVIASGIERNMSNPGCFAAENLRPGDTGRFFDDYCNWQRIPEFDQVIRQSPAAQAAAELMNSNTAQLFHDHVLVKEPGTSKATPWHQDAPYYFVGGRQNVSFWIPVDPVKEATLRCIAGSHHWPKLVLPVRWLSNENFYAGESEYLPVPDPDAELEAFDVLEWEMAPGDAIAFHYQTVHGARANLSTNRRRAFSLRWVGDDARYVTRPGPTSPPFPNHGMRDGQRLREDWFPTIWDSER